MRRGQPAAALHDPGRDKNTHEGMQRSTAISESEGHIRKSGATKGDLPNQKRTELREAGIVKNRKALEVHRGSTRTDECAGVAVVEGRLISVFADGVLDGGVVRAIG